MDSSYKNLDDQNSTTSPLILSASPSPRQSEPSSSVQFDLQPAVSHQAKYILQNIYRDTINLRADLDLESPIIRKVVSGEILGAYELQYAGEIPRYRVDGGWISGRLTVNGQPGPVCIKELTPQQEIMAREKMMSQSGSTRRDSAMMEVMSRNVPSSNNSSTRSKHSSVVSARDDGVSSLTEASAYGGETRSTIGHSQDNGCITCIVACLNCECIRSTCCKKCCC